MTQQTYGEVCQEIADWINKDYNANARDKNIPTINLVSQDILDMDIHFPALFIHTMKRHIDNGQDAVNVLICDEYCAKKVFQFLHRNKE